MKTIFVAMTMLVAWANPVPFQGSFNQEANAMWEFVSAPETVADMDRLAQGALDTYKTRGAKVAMGAKNAYLVIYGARVTDAKDYVGKAKAFLSARSGEIGMELEKMAAPAVGALPRREF